MAKPTRHTSNDLIDQTEKCGSGVLPDERGCTGVLVVSEAQDHSVAQTSRQRVELCLQQVSVLAVCRSIDLPGEEKRDGRRGI